MSTSLSPYTLLWLSLYRSPSLSISATIKYDDNNPYP